MGRATEFFDFLNRKDRPKSREYKSLTIKQRHYAIRKKFQQDKEETK